VDDDMRTAIQDYLIEFCNVSEDKSENLAESLCDYLQERGFYIIDRIGNYKIEQFDEKLS